MRIRDLHYYVVPTGDGKFSITRSWTNEETNELVTLETDYVYTSEGIAKEQAEILNNEVQARMKDD